MALLDLALSCEPLRELSSSACTVCQPRARCRDGDEKRSTVEVGGAVVAGDGERWDLARRVAESVLEPV